MQGKNAHRGARRVHLLMIECSREKYVYAQSDNRSQVGMDERLDPSFSHKNAVGLQRPAGPVIDKSWNKCENFKALIFQKGNYFRI